MKKDEALEKRFAQIKTRYLEAERSDGQARDVDFMGTMRVTGSFDSKTVTGASKVTKDRITADLIKSYAQSVETEDRDLAGIK
jgi:hypothetical protein